MCVNVIADLDVDLMVDALAGKFGDHYSLMISETLGQILSFRAGRLRI